MFSPILKLEQADSRGEIYSIALPEGKELMLLHSLPNTLRGGHSHTVDEVVMVLSGSFLYHKLIEGEKRTHYMRTGEYSFNPAGMVHMGEFEEDCWLIEQKLAKGSENHDYQPWRDKVKASAQQRAK